MFPYIFLVSLLALFMGILNSLKHFSAPAIAPIFLNLSMIAVLIFIVPFMKTPTIGLALGVIVGGIIQMALQIPFLMNRGLSFAPKWNIRHPALKKIGMLMLPTIFGSAIYQINQLIGTLLDRLVQFPLGVFAIAISTAVLPSLSREAAEGDIYRLKQTLSHALRLTMFITIPAMAGLIVLGQPIITLLFQRGAFTAFTTTMTAQALLYYSIGLWAFAGLRVFVSAFYSLQDTKTPVKVAVVAMIANIVFSLALMGPLKHGGLALALSLASTLQLFMLIYLLQKRLGGIEGRAVIHSMARSLISSLIMSICIYFLTFKLFSSILEQNTFNLALEIMIIICAGLVIYGLSAYVLGSKELSSLTELVKVSKKKE
jgi:putative peptidoglycan lipid II flippase